MRQELVGAKTAWQFFSPTLAAAARGNSAKPPVGTRALQSEWPFGNSAKQPPVVITDTNKTQHPRNHLTSGHFH